MYNLVLSHELKANQNLNCKPTNQFLIEAIVVVSHNELIQIITKQLEQNADMLPENYKIFDSHNVRLLLMVNFFNVAQYLYLEKGLLGAFGLIFDDFYSQCFFSLMVEYL